MSIPEKYKFFKKYFDLNFGEYFDQVLFLLHPDNPVLDVMKFDEWLEEKYPVDYETMSMEEIIRKNYGECQLSFIEILI